MSGKKKIGAKRVLRKESAKRTRLAIDSRFEVRRSSAGKGMGMFALAPVRKGDFIMEYTGAKIPTDVANTLSTRYLFEIDRQWTIDGSSRSNIARYINHACDPNCEADIRDGRIMLYAIKNIVPGDELSFDYGEEYFDEFIKPIGCRCGTKDCRAPAPGMERLGNQVSKL